MKILNLISWPAHLWTQFPGVRFRHPPVATILHLHNHHDDRDDDHHVDDDDDDEGCHHVDDDDGCHHVDDDDDDDDDGCHHEKHVSTLYLSSAPPQTNSRWN